MASKRRIRRKACEGKQRHTSKAEAVGHATSLRYTKGDILSAYRCKFCRGWHVGHRPRIQKE